MEIDSSITHTNTGGALAHTPRRRNQDCNIKLIQEIRRQRNGIRYIIFLLFLLFLLFSFRGVVDWNQSVF